MDPTEYQRLCQRTECDQRAAALRYTGAYNETGGSGPVAVRLNHAVIGMTGEVGEMASILEKWLHYGQPLDLVHWKEELGDLLWYASLACNASGLDLGEVMHANIRKLQARYPTKYTDTQAAEPNRDRTAERQALCPTERNAVDEVLEGEAD